MFIQTQQTPNPSSLMFIPGEKVGAVQASRPTAALFAVDQRWQPCSCAHATACAPVIQLPNLQCFLPATSLPAPRQVMELGSKSFTSAREAMASPLAKKLFHIDGVTQVGRHDL